MEEIHVYTDGANQVHKSKAGGWGAVILQGDQQIEICGGEKNTTNNRMEMVACIRALQAIETQDIPIFIYSDSQYVVNTMQVQEYKTWKENGWRTTKRAIRNRDLWEQLIKEVENKENVTFIKVKGHSGHIYNELADDLANRGLESVLHEKMNLEECVTMEENHVEVTKEYLLQIVAKEGEKWYVYKPNAVQAYQIHEDFIVHNQGRRLQGKKGDYVVISAVNGEMLIIPKEIFAKAFVSKESNA